MKYIQNLALALFLIFSISLTAQTGGGDNYSVELGKFINPFPTSFSTVKNQGYLYAINAEGNNKVVYLGGFKTKADAEKAVDYVKNKGYIDAKVKALVAPNTATVTVIQLGVTDTRQAINWSKYSSAGKLYALLDGKSIKILAGTYPSIKSAKAILPTIQRKGFGDAFVKNVSLTVLHEVTDFETGGSGFRWNNDVPVITKTEENENKTEETAKGVPGSYNTEVEIIPPVKIKNEEVKKERKPRKKVQSKALIAKKPAIRSDVKRTAVVELQKILKNEATYNSSLDGFYGKGTQAAFEETWSKSRQLNKYRLLAKYEKEQANSRNAGGLQYAVDGLWDNPKNALLTLERSNSPIAKAYRAYWLYENSDNAQKIDDLMNAAIKEAFSGAGSKNAPKFDYSANYSYRDFGQLLQHLSYVQSVSNDRISVPCWMFERYQAQALQVFGTAADAGNLDLQDCGGFIDWEELEVLSTIANDMSAGSRIDGAKEAEYRLQAIRLFLAPVAPSSEEAEYLDVWHEKLLKGMNGWATQDPTLKEMATAFSLTFYQSYILLEDFFVEKGYNSVAAKALSLSALQSVLGAKVDRFM